MENPTLVTGGCGFVGRNLTSRLVNEGRDVHVVDNLMTGRRPEQWLPEEFGEPRRIADDVFEYESEQSFLRFYHRDVRSFLAAEGSTASYDQVFHLAAIIGGRTTIEGEPLSVASDLSIDARLFNWAIEARPNHVLYASSSAAYPIHLQDGDAPVKLEESVIDFEDRVGVPDMTYGWSKLTGEYLARIAARDYDLSVSVVRPFSGYGETQDFDYPIPAIAKRAYEGQDPLTVWGSGRQVRDFVYIYDCVDAMLRTVETISDATAVNIGTGKPVEFFEVAEIFAEIAGYDPEIVNLPDKPEGPKYRCADTTRVEQTLEWSPNTEPKDGFERVFEEIPRRLGS